MDTEDIYDLIDEALRGTGYDPQKLVWSGIEGAGVITKGSFGDRSRTFGMTGATTKMIEHEGNHQSPIGYMEAQDAHVPAIAVFDPDRLGAGATFTHGDLHPITAQELEQPQPDLVCWQTLDGSSLDSATVAMFVFET